MIYSAELISHKAMAGRAEQDLIFNLVAVTVAVHKLTQPKRPQANKTKVYTIKHNQNVPKLTGSKCPQANTTKVYKT